MPIERSYVYQSKTGPRVCVYRGLTPAEWDFYYPGKPWLAVLCMQNDRYSTYTDLDRYIADQKLCSVMR
jgi:hypothetical protein